MSIFKIAWANIRKHKGASFTFLIMVIIASLALSYSLSLLIGSSGFYDKKAEELNAPHFSYFIGGGEYKEEYYDYAKSYSGVTDAATINIQYVSNATWEMKSGKTTTGVMVVSESQQSFYKPQIIDKQAAADDMIILPMSFKTSGFTAGESITLEISGQKYEYTINGFREDAVFGASTMSISWVYVSESRFNELSTDINYAEYNGFMLRFDDYGKAAGFATALRKAYPALGDGDVFGSLYEESKSTAMLFVNIIALILVVFSLIILLIAFIVAVFSIGNGITEDIKSIGAMKSVGYKDGRLRGGQLVQYLLTAAMGALIGSVISLLTFGLLGNIVAATSGLLWVSGSNVLPALLTVLSVLAVTALITYLATRRYKKITPVSAMREYNAERVVVKNILPLERYNLPVNLHMGAKRFIASPKNNIILCVVIALLVFVSLVVNVANYNLNTDRTAMIQMVGLEMSELYAAPLGGVDINDMRDKIESDDVVKTTVLFGAKTCIIDEFETSVNTVEDYSKLVTDTLVRGRHPTSDSEVTLGAVTSKTVRADVGDKVELEINSVKRTYTVSGITQNIANGGSSCSIATHAMLAHNPDFSYDTVYIYMQDGADVKAYANELKNYYGSDILLADTNEQMDSILSSMGDPFAIVSIVMIAVTVVVIAFVLFLMISALIRKLQKEFGILKAMGIKTRSLVLQLLISLLPSLIVGSAIGVLGGFLLTNPLFSLFFSAAGLANTYFIIPVASTLLIALLIFGVAIATAFLISLRLRKISPQKLITS